MTKFDYASVGLAMLITSNVADGFKRTKFLLLHVLADVISVRCSSASPW